MVISIKLLDRIKYDGPPDVLVGKYAKENIVLGSQLIVNQSQEAVFFKDGRAFDVFGPGRHTISTNNIPLLQKLVNLPFDGDTPFAAEVYFVNRVSKLDYKWGTRTPIPVEDPKYRVLVSIGAFGQFGLRVRDSQNFITTILGTVPVPEGRKGIIPCWESNNITDYFRGLVLTCVKDSIAKFLAQKGISIVELTAHLDELSKVVEDMIEDEFARFGIEVMNFFITSITIPDDEIQRIQKGQFERLEIEQLGDDRYHRMRSLNVMEAAADNPGAPGTLLAGGMGLGIGVQMMTNAAKISQQTLQPSDQAEQLASECPKCKAKVPSGSKFCTQCGANLASMACPSCGAAVSADSKFCNHCGKMLGTSKCPDCGTDNASSAKFCSKCGRNLGTI